MKQVYHFILAALLVLPLYAADPEDLPTNPPSGYYDNAETAGKVDNITYGNNYPARVYMPPGYDENKTYASMYLMHGMGGSERSWHDNDLYAHRQLDNLIAAGRVDGFVLVFTKNDMNNWNFEDILIDELIPYIEEHYSVSKDPEHRALGGLSMGGMQTINIGFPNADKFRYLMPCSSAPGVQQERQLFPDDGVMARENLKLLLFTWGEREIGAYGEQNNTRVMGYCENQGISEDIIFDYVAPGGGHDRNTWRPSFWNFAQMAYDRGLTDIEGTSVRKYSADNFTIVTSVENVGVFDLRGKLLKHLTPVGNALQAGNLAPGSYIIRWQSSSGRYVSRPAICNGNNRLTIK